MCVYIFTSKNSYVILHRVNIYFSLYEEIKKINVRFEINVKIDVFIFLGSDKVL